MDAESLNEIASLLHITSEIATNHPKLGAIARACQERLDEINLEAITAENKKAEAKKQDEAKKAAAEYKAPKPGDQNYVAPEKPLETQSAPTSYDHNAEVERRV